MKMNCCMECGTRLAVREHPTEGPTPFCEVCGEYRYPVFNIAVSMLVMNPERTQIILIRQYGRPHAVLVAGYVNRGEDAEDAVRREVQEELGLEVKSLQFNRSRFYPPSNTLMLNFTVTVEETAAHPNWEVDSWAWYPIEEAREAIKPGSLARAFLLGFLDRGVYDFPEYPES